MGRRFTAIVLKNSAPKEFFIYMLLIILQHLALLTRECQHDILVRELAVAKGRRQT